MNTRPDALINNQRLFTQYYEKLSQIENQAVFLGAADAFSKWLTDQRAYYAAARPAV